MRAEVPLDRPRATGVRVERSSGALDDLLRDHDLLDAPEAWQVEHGVKEYGLHDGAQPARPGLAVNRLPGDGSECFPRHREIDALHLEQSLILLHQRVLRPGQNELERGLVEILKRRYDRKSADEFRDQAVFEQVFRLDVTEDLALLSILGRDALGAEADRARSAARRNDLLEAGERAAAHKQDIGGVDLQEFLLRMLAATLRWHRRDRA